MTTWEVCMIQGARAKSIGETGDSEMIQQLRHKLQRHKEKGKKLKYIVTHLRRQLQDTIKERDGDTGKSEEQNYGTLETLALNVNVCIPLLIISDVMTAVPWPIPATLQLPFSNKLESQSSAGSDLSRRTSTTSCPVKPTEALDKASVELTSQEAEIIERFEGGLKVGLLSISRSTYIVA